MHRAADREPGGPQAEGARDRRAGGADAGRAVRIVPRRRREPPRPPPPATWRERACARSSTRCARGGDRAVLRLTERFDQAELGPEELRVSRREIEASVGVLEPDVLRGLRTAIANVRAVVEAQLRDPGRGRAARGPRVEIAEVPVRRARRLRARRARRRTRRRVVMCAVTARAAGVDEIAVCAPPGPGRPRAPGDPRRLRAVRRDRGLPRWAAPRRSPRSPTAPRRCARST